MTAAHTPGPWVYAAEYGQDITEPPCITTVARCARFVIGLESDYPGGNYRDGEPSGDEEADARLIAAAPDLLEALQKLIEASEDSDGACYGTISTSFVRGIASEAIAKATGGQS